MDWTKENKTLKLFNWIGHRRKKVDFEKIFSVLKTLSENNENAQKTLELLFKLKHKTSDSASDVLISELQKIRFHSNTSAVFHFYFPIISHILFYKPQYETDLLGHLIGPNFANGVEEAKEFIPLLQRAMNFQLSKNKYYATKEGQSWVQDQLPKMEKEVEREVQKCWDS